MTNPTPRNATKYETEMATTRNRFIASDSKAEEHAVVEECGASKQRDGTAASRGHCLMARASPVANAGGTTGTTGYR
jgi:hypothetical protein